MSTRITQALLYLEGPADEALFDGAMAAIGAVALSGNEPATLRSSEQWDGMGNGAVQLAPCATPSAIALATAAAKALKGTVTAIVATVTPKLAGKKLTMTSELKTFDVTGDGSTEMPPPMLDDSWLAYEDEEPREQAMSPDDLAVAASEFAGRVLDEARKELLLSLEGKIRTREARWRMAPTLAPRLRALLDAIEAGANHTSQSMPDGRFRIDVVDPNGKRTSFLSADEHAALMDRVTKR